MTDVPGDTPVIKPPGPPAPPAVTVATPGLVLDQDPKLVASLNWVVDPTHTLAVPVIAAIVGNAFTVTVLSDVAAPHE
jgi:hypothetical protein